MNYRHLQTIQLHTQTCSSSNSSTAGSDMSGGGGVDGSGKFWLFDFKNF
jgi:hypothetical protein